MHGRMYRPVPLSPVIKCIFVLKILLFHTVTITCSNIKMYLSSSHHLLVKDHIDNKNSDYIFVVVMFM